MKASCQIYVKGSIEAVALYQKAFNLTLGMTGLNEDGTYAHVSLMDGDDEFLCVAEDLLNECNDKIVGDKCPVMCFNVYPIATKEALYHAYAVLSENARINLDPDGPTSPLWDEDGKYLGFGLLDKFGVYWGVLYSPVP